MSYSVAMNLRRVSSTNINQMLNVLRVSLLSMKASITTVYSDKHQRAIRYIKHEMTLRLAGGCWLSPTALLSNYDRYPPFRHTERLSDTTAASNAPFLPCGPDIGLERTKLNGYFLHSLQYHGRFAGSRHVFDLMTSNLARMGFLTWATRGRHRIKDSSSCLTNRSIQR